MRKVICASETAKGLWDEMSSHIAGCYRSGVVICFDAGGKYVTLKGDELKQTLMHGVKIGVGVSWPMMLADFDVGPSLAEIQGWSCRLSYWYQGIKYMKRCVGGIAVVTDKGLGDWYALCNDGRLDDDILL